MDRPTWLPSEVDLTRPSAARVYDFYLGGSHNLDVDRRMAREALARAQFDMGMYEEARENFAWIISINPADDYAQFGLGLAATKLGDLPAAGRTSLELRDQIAGALKDYITNPVVTVMVLETTPQVVYVMGEVTKPGTLQLAGGRLSILQALAMAGGFTDFANKKDIRILRHAKNGMQTLRFNYKDALEDSHEPLQLLPGDTVIVK